MILQEFRAYPAVEPTPTPTFSHTPTFTKTPTVTRTPTLTPTYTFTSTPTFTLIPTITPTPTSPFTGHECDSIHWDTNIASLGYATAQNHLPGYDPRESIDRDISSQNNGWRG